uniref:uncharacterized protein LOC113475436 n=1 Tax=Ciona intestinalis TaxID=7719 RepID=UPI0005213553|nr:uncharacterized protein LOC113475436 [Ciona intestinalis]|eukprot:XP_026695406.1 uncharacterized protein LOC113475436 [Ciona intestinalis]
MVICLRQFVLVLIYGCTFARGICTDTAVLGYCTASVCSNQQARSVCLRTCGFCLDSQGGAPAFAQPPPNVNVMSRPENNYNGHSIDSEKTKYVYKWMLLRMLK